MARGVDRALVRRWCDACVEALAAARAEIDATNVFPVPDRDTGTNVLATMTAARGRLAQQPADGEFPGLDAVARGALLGAQGSSGAILAQLLRGAADHLAAAGPAESAAQLVAGALTTAADAGYRAVGRPVEGTILTVARAAADAARRAAAAPGTVAATLRAAVAGAEQALAASPSQLPPLAAAGVVDAGGQALCVVLRTLVAAADGTLGEDPSGPSRVDPSTDDESRLAGDSELVPGPAAGASAADAPTGPASAADAPTGPAAAADAPTGPAFEVTYLLDSDDAGVRRLRGRLDRLGDAIVVAGGGGLWNVHVHTDDPGSAVEAGIAAGHPHRVRVVHLPPSGLPDRAVVAVAAGPGLAALFAAAGASVVSVRPGVRPTAEDLVAAIRSGHAGEVVVLPNDPTTVAVAEEAAARVRSPALRVAVIPTRAQVQGLAAVAVHEPSRGFEEAVVSMTAAAGHARHAAVTLAEREALTSAGHCRVGDALGVVDGDFAVIGTDPAAVAVEATERLLVGGGELVTLVTGLGCDPAVPAAVAAHVRRYRVGVDTVVHDGRQERYLLLVGVE